ncbi:helix-turn-helix domain-containing protein [Spirosoma aerophilum]
MVSVITKEEFEPVLQRLETLERENAFLRSIFIDLKWLNVNQVAKALNCSDSTVYRLIKSGTLEHRLEGTRPMCSIEAVRSYLSAKKILPYEVDYRLVSACQTV